MKVNIVKASKRFSNTFFPSLSNRLSPEDPPITGTSEYLIIEYQCVGCNSKISFEEKDFNKHSNAKHTNLSDKDDKEINDEMLKRELTNFDFLDFYCPECRVPTRVYYEVGAGDRVGLTYQLKYVVEVKK